MAFITKIKTGDRRILARAITIVENNLDGKEELLRNEELLGAQVQVIGITGPPGSGKSTLVNELIKEYRKKNYKIAILAIDPTSPYSGGAILGDRIRMLDFTLDPQVYVRSLASRGQLGGVSASTFDIISLLKQSNFDKILVETVGAGQSEIAIVQNADTTIVLTIPGIGDDIQIIKAGIMEIADLFVINKSDLGGAKQLGQRMKNMQNLTPAKSNWIPSIIQISALNGSQISDLVKLIDDHWFYLGQNGRLLDLRAKQIRSEIIHQLNDRIIYDLLNNSDDPLAYSIEQILNSNWSKSDAIKYLVSKLSVTYSSN